MHNYVIEKTKREREGGNEDLQEGLQGVATSGTPRRLLMILKFVYCTLYIWGTRLHT